VDCFRVRLPWVRICSRLEAKALRLLISSWLRIYDGECSPGFAIIFLQIMERGLSIRVAGVDPVAGLVVGL